jgi:hypothetical protein
MAKKLILHSDGKSHTTALPAAHILRMSVEITNLMLTKPIDTNYNASMAPIPLKTTT